MKVDTSVVVSVPCSTINSSDTPPKKKQQQQNSILRFIDVNPALPTKRRKREDTYHDNITTTN
jgi:hypothetical protein